MAVGFRNRPFEKCDQVHDTDPAAVRALANLFHRSASFDPGIDFLCPGFDAVIPGIGRDIHVLQYGDSGRPDRAGIEAVVKTSHLSNPFCWAAVPPVQDPDGAVEWPFLGMLKV